MRIYLRLSWPRTNVAALQALRALFPGCRIVRQKGEVVLEEGAKKSESPTMTIVRGVGITEGDLADPLGPKDKDKDAPKAERPVHGFVFVVECEGAMATTLLKRDNRGSIIARPYLESASEPKCPNTGPKGEVLPCKKGKEHGQPAPRQELVIDDPAIADYLADLRLIGTYAGEAEAAKLAARLTRDTGRNIGFNVCEDTATAGVLRYVHSFGPPGDLWLRFAGAHYRVVVRDPDGPLTVIRTFSNGTSAIVGRFREHAVDSRVDGSCLFDSCHIAVFGVAATNEQILGYRGDLAVAMSHDDVRHILTALAYDLAHGVAIPGLGKKVSARLSPFVDVLSKRSCRVRGTGLVECDALASHEALDGVMALKRPLVFTLPKDGGVEITSVEIANALLGKKAKDGDLVLASPSSLTEEGGYLVTTFCSHCDEVTFLHVIVDRERDVSLQGIEVFLGPEYTFTNQVMREATQQMAAAIAKKKRISPREAAEEVLETHANSAKRDQWRKLLTDKPIPDSKVERTRCKDLEAFKVTLKEGWWYQVTLDPSCLEVQTCPMTLTTLRNLRGAIQANIFDVAKNTLELEDHRDGGGGHMHLGILRTFGRDALLFRNFFVDLCNNPLVLVAFDDDTINAPLLRERPRAVQAAFAEGLEAMDDRFLSASPASGQDLIVAFAEMLHGAKIYGCHEQGFKGDDTKHYQGLNVERVVTQPEVSRTIEVRRLRAQESVDEFILIGAMFEARIRYLHGAHARETIAFEPGDPIGPAYAEGDVARALKQYLGVAGVDPTPYQRLWQRNFGER